MITRQPVTLDHLGVTDFVGDSHESSSTGSILHLDRPKSKKLERSNKDKGTSYKLNKQNIHYFPSVTVTIVLVDLIWKCCHFFLHEVIVKSNLSETFRNLTSYFSVTNKVRKHKHSVILINVILYFHTLFFIENKINFHSIYR